MSTAAAVQQKEKAKAPVIVNDPAFIDTSFGPVVVFGHHLISKKDLIILEHCLSFPDAETINRNNTIKSIIFRDDNKPKDTNGVPVLGNVSFDHNSISINLLKIVSDAILEAQNKPEVAILASYHKNLLMTILHEIHHLSSLDEFPTDPVEVDVEETAAEAWGLETLFYIAKNFDIEPAHHSESSFLAGQLMELLLEDNSEWAIKQRNMLDNHMFYHLPDKHNKREVSIHSFKEYMRFQSSDFESKEWDNITIKGAIQDTTQALVVEQPATPAMAFSNSAATVVQDPVEVENDWISVPEAFYDHGEVEYTDFPIETNLGETPSMQGYAQSYQAPAPQYSYPQQPATTKAPAKVYTETGFTEEQTAEIVKAVYFKCYNHLFGVCGRRLDSDKPFDFPEAVFKVGIPLTEQEMQVVVKMDCSDANERFCGNVSTSGGKLFGMISSRIRLPMYKLYINMNGYELCRLLMPQNTAKPDGIGGLTKQALAARSGSTIMYIKEGNDNVIKAGGEVWRHKIVNGEFMKG